MASKLRRTYRECVSVVERESRPFGKVVYAAQNFWNLVNSIR